MQINEDINENAADFDISYYLSYTLSMKHYEWNDAKNTLLKTERDVSFEDVITAISEGFVFDDVKHPNVKKYPDQRILVVRIEDYIYIVPYIEKDDTTLFLKTVIPSRKATKKYFTNNNQKEV